MMSMSLNVILCLCVVAICQAASDSEHTRQVSLQDSPLPVAISPALACYVLLAATTITNTGLTVVTGNLGLSPGVSITGFPPGVYTGSQHIADSEAAARQLDLTAAYADAASRPTNPLPSADIGGQTLQPGVYTAPTALGISSDLTLDGLNNVNAVWIFQIGTTLDLAAGVSILLINGARAQNVFWQIGSSATLNIGSHMVGTLMAYTSITIVSTASLNGRAFVKNAAITLDTNIITAPAGCADAQPSITASSSASVAFSSSGAAARSSSARASVSSSARAVSSSARAPIASSSAANPCAGGGGCAVRARCVLSASGRTRTCVFNAPYTGNGYTCTAYGLDCDCDTECQSPSLYCHHGRDKYCGEGEGERNNWGGLSVGAGGGEAGANDNTINRDVPLKQLKRKSLAVDSPTSDSTTEAVEVQTWWGGDDEGSEGGGESHSGKPQHGGCHDNYRCGGQRRQARDSALTGSHGEGEGEGEGERRQGKCPSGRVRGSNGYSGVCYVNACSVSGVCGLGVCVPTGDGQYRCACNNGCVLSDNNNSKSQCVVRPYNYHNSGPSGYYNNWP